MNISDLRDGARQVSVEGFIAKKGETRQVSTRTGGQSQVCDAILKDDSGTVKLSLWDSQIDQVSEGDRVSIGNAYVNSFRGEKQLNIGRYGTLSVQDSL